MNYKEKYAKWLDYRELEPELRDELLGIQGKDEEIKDRFYADLKFGTAGLRGKLGAGTNRMNRYTVAQATQGLAETIKSRGEEAMKKGVAIAYDVRYGSDLFSKITAQVLAANGIKVYIHKEIQPTPVLSYTIRKLGTISGVMITASHNPKEYNGYKAYWKEGSQILEEIADEIVGHIQNIDLFTGPKKIPFEEGLESGMIEYIGDEVLNDYMKDILSLSILDEGLDKDINIVYTPLNGTGNKLVQRILKERGFNNVHVVPEQEYPDPDFTTVGYPNPEDPKAFAYAEKLGEEVGAELLMATDPDSDRMAIEVRKGKEYIFLNGNRIGALLCNYILEKLEETGRMPENPVCVKSIVTGDLTKAICKDKGVEMLEVLTGFKNIAAPANQYDITHEKTFVFGFEESIGYNYGNFVRDKDAVNAAMMIAEMAAYYKSRGKSLLDVLHELFEKYGYYRERLKSVVLEGLDGQALIGRIMEEFRGNPIKEMEGMKLEKVIDYEKDETGLSKSNVLKYYYDDGSWFALRPSGTEPKIKLYIYTKSDSDEEAIRKLDIIEDAATAKMTSVK